MNIPFLLIINIQLKRQQEKNVNYYLTFPAMILVVSLPPIFLVYQPLPFMAGEVGCWPCHMV
jgi:hypothetical protein